MSTFEEAKKAYNVGKKVTYCGLLLRHYNAILVLIDINDYVIYDLSTPMLNSDKWVIE